MTDILFYHLTESKLEDALPPLVDKSVERGWRVVIQTADDDKRDRLDDHLWTWREDSFLPHGTDAGPHASPRPNPQSGEDGTLEHQPVLLTVTPENANKATVRFLVDGAEPPDLADYDRVVFMFDGYDQQQLEGARAQWKRLKSEGHTLTYWQQSSEGRWEKKA